MFILGLSCGIAFSEDEGAVLKKRAAEYWEARAKCDWQKLYSFLPPSEKQKLTPEQFTSTMDARNAFKFLSWQILDGRSEKATGWVELENTIQSLAYDDMPPKKVRFWQVWNKLDGSWHPLPNDSEIDAPRIPPHLRNMEEENRLTQRVTESWEAKEKADWAKVYEFFDPKFKEENPADKFLQRTAMNTYLGHEIEWIEAIGTNGRVKIKYVARSNDPSLSKLDPTAASAVENWTLVDGQWYLDTTSKK
jgi:hypothetical protein